MSYERGKVFSTVLDEDAKLELLRLAKSSKKAQRIIASHAIMQVAPMRMLDRDWEARIKELEGVRVKVTRDKSLDPVNVCDHLAESEDVYRCVFARAEKPPDIKKLGTYEEKEAICAVCDKDKTRINLEERWNQIIATPLEEYTYCSDGGEYDNNSGRIYCPHLKVWQAQDKCFTLYQGGRCMNLKTLPKRPTRQTGMTRRRRR